MTSFIKTCVTLLLVYLLVALTNDVAAQTTVGLVQKDTGTTEKGYILFAPLADTTTYLIDKCGRKIHTWHSSYKPGASVYLEPNGYLLRAGTYFNPLFPAGGSGGIVQVLDWNSNVTGAYIVSDSIYQSHHDVRALPNGNILVLAWERKTTAEAIAAGRNPLHAGSSVWSEAVLELHPVSDKKATVVWEWHLWDHLVQDFDATKPNYAAVASRPGRIDINYTPKDTVPDWVHLNAIDYNPAFDQVMINSPNFNELYIIDHSTTTAEARTGKGGRYGKGGNILYRWGNPLVYKSGTQADQQLFFQHNAHWIEPGLPYANQIMVFNNGQGRNGGINDYSTVDIIIPPVDSAGNYAPGLPYGPAAAALVYNEGNENHLYSPFISGAQMLENANVLVCSGANGNFFEYNPGGQTVWRYINPVTDLGIVKQGDSPVNNLVFRSPFYPAAYQGLQGHTLAPGTTIENENILSSQCSLPGLYITNAQIAEGDGGTKTMRFRVSLSEASQDSVVVNFQTRDIAATAPADYLPASGLILFKPGDTVKVIRVTINGDLVPEADERFAVGLFSPVNAVLLDSVGIGKISNDDAAFASTVTSDASGNNTGKFIIYPNPVQNTLTVTLPADHAINALYVLDITGRILKKIKATAAQGTYSIDVSAFAKGSYLLRAESPKGNASAVFIKN